MPKKERKKRPDAGGKRAKSRGSAVRAPAPRRPSGPPEKTAARERFVSDLLVRGEAAERDKKGKLPLHATHVIKKRKPGGSTEVERVRFKTF